MVNFMTFMEYFATFAAFVGGVTLVVQFIKNLFKIEKKGWKVATAFIVSIIGALVGFYFQLGFFTEYGTPDTWQGWTMAGLTGIGGGVAACGFYDIKMVEAIVKWVWSFMKTEPKIINE